VTDKLFCKLLELGFDTISGVAATGGDDDFYLQLIFAFQAEFLNDLQLNEANQDISTLKPWAHSLKGVLRTLGETRVAALVERFELTLAGGELDQGQLYVINGELKYFANVLTKA
jgi:HPt (histidine-containing phosphotransfer) domain-containing protein